MNTSSDATALAQEYIPTTLTIDAERLLALISEATNDPNHRLYEAAAELCAETLVAEAADPAHPAHPAFDWTD